MMSSATHSALGLRPTQSSAMSKPKGVYSIDQILGTQHRKNHNNNGECFNVF